MKLPRDEFEALALQQLDAVDRVARSLTRNAAEADDLVQETFLRAIRSWESFDLQAFGIRPWLFRILHNLHITRATREKRQPRAVEAEMLQGVEDASDVGQLPAGLAGLDPELDQALNDLPSDLRTALMLWAIDDLSYKQIAEVMDVPIGTVMSRLYRARQKLVRRLQNRAPTSRGIPE